MNLLEILNTKPAVSWTSQGHRNVGTFELDGSIIRIFIDEYDVFGLDLIELGFDTDESYAALNSSKPAAKVLGAVLNGSIPQILKIDPDVILLAIDKTSGLVESRMSLYDSMLSFIRHRIGGVSYISGWEDSGKALFKIIARGFNPTADEKSVFINTISAKRN